MRYPRLFLFFVLSAVLLAACGSGPEPEPTFVPPTLVATAAAPIEAPTTVPTQTAADLYCPQGDFSTDWCVCAEIINGDLGPIDALRRVSNSEPGERSSSFGHRIEILINIDGSPDRIEVYSWETLLSEFNTTVHAGDVICDAYKPTISKVYSWLELDDYLPNY